MKSKKGFTLVELIVVITILAILATIWYVSFLGYASYARDSTRLTDIWIINHGLEYHKLAGSSLPQPDNAIPISVSGSIVWYQWYAGTSVLWAIGVHWWQDPLDGNYYSYFLRKNYVQVLALFENEQNINTAGINSESVYADNSDRYPFFKWWWLGMFLENDNTPIHQSADVQLAWEFDILDTTLMSREIQPLFTNKDRYTARAIMIWWQLSVDPVVTWNMQCPDHYIPVPWNKELGQPPFCIWKYEAYSSNGTTTWWYHTAPGNQPVIEISATNNSGSTFMNCSANGENYHIMTMMEWLTIARNIEMVGSNWTWWITGSWYIIWGNNSDNITWFDINWIKLIWGNDIRVTWEQNEMRTLTLSNWEIIWDFIWNVAELVKGLNNYTLDNSGWWELFHSTDSANIFSTALDLTWVEWITNGTYNNWENITDKHFKTMYGPKSLATTSQWIWSVLQHNNRTFAVWWYAVSSHTAPLWAQGLYSILKLWWTSYSDVWTRCAYSY